MKTARMEQNSNLYGLNQRLFWDIDTRNFNIDESAAWIIQRVLEYGTMKDWMIIEDHFGVDKIVSYAQTLRTLDPVALSFLCFISGTKKRGLQMLSFRTIVPHTLEHLKDLAVQKIHAIEGRGSKKDFIDLYFLLQHYALEEIRPKVSSVFHVQGADVINIFRGC